ncbi:MAG: tetratricopeptide repeat protein [Betaproteobacteria bacterium]|nr:tetratricopeptide repeat protein [Betaproteobacteria bacterium]
MSRVRLPGRVSVLALAATLMLAGCAGRKTLPGDDQPTLASLGTRSIKVTPDEVTGVAEEQTIAAYRQFLQAAPNAPQRPEALRRLGDLEMDRADRIAAEATAAAGAEPDYKAGIARYEEFLKAYPQDARNDRVLYQLARAQEQGGDLENALKTLTRLVSTFPGTLHADEAQFRRGELLFAMRDYKQAETAYAAVLGSGKAGTHTPFVERALYMQGWSLFKQGRLEDALQPFFGVLDLKLGGLPANVRDEADLANVRALTRADRELVDDSFRVMGIALSNLQGAESIGRYITTPAREGYQFRVYSALGELYIRQERIKDAADTLALFVRRQPLHAQAPLLQARVIEIYERNGFDTLALQAKKDHVLRYGIESEFRRANPSGWQGAQALVKTHLVQLARHHHALAQKSRAPPDVQEAVRWYGTLLTSFPTDAEAPANRFLLAELLFEDKRWADAAREYETVAYTPAPAPLRGTAAEGAAPPAPSTPLRRADAGYAALLAYAAQEKDSTDAAQRTALQRTAVASSLRFADAFPTDARNGAVLVRASEQLFALGDAEAATTVARQALALQPPPAPELRRTAWTVLAHHAFEQARHAEAEAAYGEVLALSPAGSPGRAEFVERLAAAIYKQGEAARSNGDGRAAVGHFQRVAALGTSAGLAATSAVRASAQFDAAAALIGLKDWDAAAQALEDFRRQQPGHALQAEVAPRLALAYLELGRNSLAAAEFERVASASAQPELARGALWQAAELHEKAALADQKARSTAGAAGQAGPAPATKARTTAAARPAPAKATRSTKTATPAPLQASSPLMATALNAYERYLQQYPQPLETAVEARWRLAELSRQDGQPAQAAVWQRAVQQADAQAGEARTPRTRTLGGLATLALAEPVLADYRQVALVEPLAKQLKLKKAKMEEALRAYALASEAGIAEVTTAATFHAGAVYQDFGKALINSARPKKLNKAELEQYNVMLEEQAFPFEEKAIELFEANARRAATGLYDPWVQRSYAALAQLKPVRYGKTERADAALPLEVAALETALQASPRPDAVQRVALLNQLGIAQRRTGSFEQARAAYEAAIALNPDATAPQVNLAILLDLYLGDNARALALYQRCQELSPADAPVLGRWAAELKARKPTPASPASAEAPAKVAATASKDTP